MAHTLKSIRVYRQMTRKEAADRIGVPETTLENWERFKSVPRADVLPAILKAYECNLEDLEFFCPEHTQCADV